MEDFFSLKDKVIIITGGAGLIGGAYVEACARYGAKVFLADINDEAAKKVASEVQKKTGNADVFYQKCSIVKKTDVDNLISKIVAKFGRIDALVNNAYPKNKNYGKKYEQVTYEDFC